MILQIPEVLAGDALAALRQAVEALPFVDGKATAGGAAAAVKNNEQADLTLQATAQAQKQVLAALQSNEAFGRYALPLRIMPPLFNRYGVGMGYGDHIDRPVMQGTQPVRTDLAMTLFLSGPEAYDGGELVISSDFGPQRVRLPAGSVVLYPASTLHRVEPVQRGVRLAAVTWVQSMVREHDRRQLLAELAQVRGGLDEQRHGAESLKLQKIRATLLRWWADV